MDTLAGTDRCDRCLAQARVRFIKDISVLDFCNHHANTYADELDKQGWSISIDDRELLTRRAVGTEVA